MRGYVFLIGLCLLLNAATGRAQEDDDEENPFRAGLLATYQQKGLTVTRIETAPSLDWGALPPDIRFDSGKIEIAWQGRLLTQGADEYRLHVYAVGDVKVQLGGKVVVNGWSDGPEWFSSDVLKLEHDYHPLTIKYAHDGDAKRLRLFWSSATFPLEAVPARQLYHEFAKVGDLVDSFAVGQQVAREKRCAACHDIPGEEQALAAPALDRLNGNLHHDWLTDWLQSSHVAPARLSTEDAASLSTYLLKEKVDRPAVTKVAGDSAKGRKLFATLGCFACHQMGELGNAGPLSGGDLTNMGRKHPTEFFARWLANPAELNREHRMPTYELSPGEREDLSAFLTRTRAQDPFQDEPRMPPGDSLRGKELFATMECASCHRGVDGRAAHREVRLSMPTKGKCANSPVAQQVSAAEQKALDSFFRTVARPAKKERRPLDAGRILAEKNCLNCHAREGAEGLAPKLVALAKADADLAPLVPALTPPSLLAVGDKLNDTVLLAMMKRMEQPHRDYLQVRMPRYDFSQQELETLLAYFIAYDRIPPHPPDERVRPPQNLPKEKELADAGQKLVVANSGFGCTSCHAIGKYLPSKAPINARGPNLTNIGFRIREPYFYRWCKNPARIVPGQEMPSVSVPVKKVLNENLDHQLAALWTILNTPGFEPKDVGPLRVVRRSGDPKAKERAVVGTDVIKIDGKTYIAPLIIGLPNRHNVLFDMETGSLARWWLGDTMEQRTQGKTWFWQTDAPDLLQADAKEPELTLIRDKQRFSPVKQGQVRYRLERWGTGWGDVTGSVTIIGYAQFPIGERDKPVVVEINQAFFPRNDNTFERQINLRGVSRDATVVLRVMSATAMKVGALSPNRRNFTVGDGNRVEIVTEDCRFEADGTVGLKQSEDHAQVVLRYHSASLPEAPPGPAPVATVNQSGSLNAVPGLTATRLKTDSQMMPTGMSWSKNALYVASLEGRVWAIQDTDNDTFEDDAKPVSDELAAPYGIYADPSGRTVDVITKYGLLRLVDKTGQVFFESTLVQTTDWGHTDDYHDWAVGLVPNGTGRYFAALPCQQDGRSPEAAHRRGQAIEIAINPLGFFETRQVGSITAVSEGHRFPMGIARNRASDVFVTDNQGNYNPFNELNHVQKGKHFGFVNAIDKNKPKPPTTPPAINIPHPWTRSVNGICFLETPEALLKENQKPLWGAIEGHLIGCEYDTRRLIRMSLQKVGDTYQGACYPFSLEKPKGENFLGPISCAISPRGELYVGSIRDSGWGGGANVGEIVRIDPPGEKALPQGIAEVRATKKGFVIRFTQAVDATLASDAKNYSIESFTRESTPAYGGPDQDRRAEKITTINVAEDRLSATLELLEMRTGYVYEFHLRPLHAGEFFPAEAYYTLNFLPE